MANVCCIFVKFCVFCLIFIEFSYSNEIQFIYSVDSPNPHLENIHTIKLRDKREISSPVPAVATNTTAAPLSTPAAPPAAPPAIVPDQKNNNEHYNLEGTQHLLGANGTGQRKDMTNITATQPTIVPDATNSSKKNNLGATLHSVVGTTPASPIVPEDEYEKVVDSIDEPDDTINKTINEHLVNSTMKKDYFQYYESVAMTNKNKSADYWTALGTNFTVSTILSKSHRRAITVQLSFDFPFYGHVVRNVTVATGGFLYTGEYVHSWLAATQYIAPLMANFDTTISDGAAVKYSDNGTAFTVVWEKVPLQDYTAKARDQNTFTFSVSLYNSGDITFAYKTIPMAIDKIKDEKHPVKIGLSDAYIIDKTIYFARRKTIYEYHRVNFGGQDILNDTLILLKAMPTCLRHTDCESCLNTPTESFNCTWCPALNRCSTGTDRKRQEWVSNNCDRMMLKDSKTCPALGSKGNNYAQQQQVPPAPANSSSADDEHNRTISSKASDVKKAMPHIDDGTGQSKQNSASFALGILLPIIVIMSLVMWVFYAYRNPHTKSGQLLIQYRPSQWSWRRGEARYTAATIHM